MFPELARPDGTYAQVDDMKGRDKAISSMLSALLMLLRVPADLTSGRLT